jgi:aspartate racemase
MNTKQKLAYAEKTRHNSVDYIQDWIHDHVVQSPDSTAMICEGKKLSYLALNRYANQVAHYLISLGVQPEMLIGICADRSLKMVIAILGILKAGGAFVPLDPTYPQDRLSYILEDAAAQFVLTQTDLLGSIDPSGKRVICLDHDWPLILQQPEYNPENGLVPDNLAYVIYTSGSTGNPKGVMITHANLSNFVRIACAALDVKKEDIYLHSASIAYALSIRQLMVPLSFGATIVLATSAQARDPLSLFYLIKRQRVSLMDMVPSFWRSCLQRLSDLPAPELERLLDNDLRRIVSVGEPLLFDIPRDWRIKLGHTANLVNIFGQTETTGVVATYPIPTDAINRTGIVPIGQCVSETKIYILDAELRPVADGEVGELCVSNPCIARGYLNRIEKTAEKFILNPFNDGFGDTLYRTGDFARYHKNGDFEFLGREDFQVKIRGQRLELGEIESVLREHSTVKNCVVISREDRPDEKYLAAYVVMNSENEFNANDLRRHLLNKVPEYMVPSIFVELETIPVTPNGKFNRHALPNPASEVVNESTIRLTPPTHSNEATAPRNHTERVIAHIWKNILKNPNIGIHDNFFDLGGQSLMAVRMFSHIERDLQVRLPLTSLFQAATIAQLSDLIMNHDTNNDTWSSVVPIQIPGDKPPFFGVHGLEGGVLFWRDIVSYLPKDQPFYAVQARGVDGIQPVLTRIEDMASLYLNDIKQVQPHGPYYLGGFSMGGEIAFEIGQQLYKQGERVALLVMFDTRNPQRPKSLTPKQKVDLHLRQLSKRNLLQKLAYLNSKLLYRFKPLYIYPAVKLYRKRNKKLPDPLLLRFLRVAHSKALNQYIPTRYPGTITIFRASESVDLNSADSPMGWGTLANEGVDIHIFDATHNIVDSEYAEEVANQLNTRLSISQSRLY